MNKPKRSDDKYWTGTRNFDNIQFLSDLEDYIFSLEERIEALAIPHVSDSHFTDFCCFVTGHDEATISQMYQDWERYR